MKYSYLIAVGFCFGSYSASAQLPPATSISQQTSLGKYNAEKTVENLVGSMYLFDDTWKSAEVKTGDGRTFKDFKIKYDIVNDKLIYQDKSNQVMEFVVPVNEFTVSDPESMIFKSGYGAINKNTPKTFYQVLSDGKIKALKKVTKTIIEAQNYNSPSVVKNIDTQTRYYFVDTKGNIQEFKTNKKAILELLKDKSAPMARYFAENKLDFKNDSDLSSVFNYYNGL